MLELCRPRLRMRSALVCLRIALLDSPRESTSHLPENALGWNTRLRRRPHNLLDEKECLVLNLVLRGRSVLSLHSVSLAARMSALRFALNTPHDSTCRFHSCAAGLRIPPSSKPHTSRAAFLCWVRPSLLPSIHSLLVRYALQYHQSSFELPPGSFRGRTIHFPANAADWRTRPGHTRHKSLSSPPAIRRQCWPVCSSEIPSRRAIPIVCFAALGSVPLPLAWPLFV